MFRRIMYLLGAASLIGVLFPTTPASANNSLTEHAAAVISGGVSPTGTNCTPAAKAEYATANDVLGANPATGELINFDHTQMLGAFGDLGVPNAYIGEVATPDGVSIPACTDSLLDDDLTKDPPPPGDTCPLSPGGPDAQRLCDLLSHGDIRDPAGTPDFVGDNSLLGKCLRGEIGTLSNTADPIPPASGDFITVGTTAFVKFDVGYTLGNLVGTTCTGKADVEEVNCIGVIGVVPVETITGSGRDEVAGAIVCHDALPSNVGAK